MFAVRGITTASRDTACDAEVQTLQTAAQSYFASNPTTIEIAGTDSDARQDVLVGAGLLTGRSPIFVISADGVPSGITPGDCAGF